MPPKPPCPAPVPTGAFWNPGPPAVEVHFDRNLTANPALDPGNWFVRWNNNQQEVLAASALDSVVTLTLDAQAPNAGPDVVNYSPPPFDVLADCGTPVAAFAGLALV